MPMETVGDVPDDHLLIGDDFQSLLHMQMACVWSIRLARTLPELQISVLHQAGTGGCDWLT